MFPLFTQIACFTIGVQNLDFGYWKIKFWTMLFLFIFSQNFLSLFERKRKKKSSSEFNFYS